MNPTPCVEQACDRPVKAWGLCARHYQRVSRAGGLELHKANLLSGRSCDRCGAPIAISRKLAARFCSDRCVSGAYRLTALAPSMTREKQREYSRASYRRAREALLLSIGPRLCAECDEPLQDGSRLRRIYCSRRCINRVSLRERRWQRTESTEKRRQLLRDASHVGVSLTDWAALVCRHAHACAYCGEVAPLTKDHVIPVSRGGRHAIGNILPACQSCNSSKGNRLLVEWRRA